MTNHVLAGLIKRRADLAAGIKQAEAVLGALLRDMDHLDGTIRQFDGSHEPPRVRTSLGRARRGEVTRALLAILRKSAEPLTLRDLTLRMMRERGLDCGGTGRRWG